MRQARKPGSYFKAYKTLRFARHVFMSDGPVITDIVRRHVRDVVSRAHKSVLPCYLHLQCPDVILRLLSVLSFLVRHLVIVASG
jgi:hypothetical protein